METNTVTLSLSDYNRLRDFKEHVENGDIAVVTIYTAGGDVEETIYYTEDEVVKQLEKVIHTLQGENGLLKTKIEILKK